MKKIFLFVLLSLSLSVFAKKKTPPMHPDSIKAKIDNKFISPALIKAEKELVALFNKILTEDTNDSARIAINADIRKKLDATLKLPGSYFYPFDSLQNLGKIYSDDYNIRIYTWACELEDLSYRFYGFVQDFYDESVYPFIQGGNVYLPKENHEIELHRWYGALYYKAMNVGSKRDPVYMLLGWTQPNPNVRAKIMDVLSFHDDGRVVLGEKIFKGYNGRAFRMTFPYCAHLSFMLNYEPKNKRFVFDHLVPVSEDKGNDKEGNSIIINSGCMGPDMSYDALKKSGKSWVLKKDINAMNDN